MARLYGAGNSPHTNFRLYIKDSITLIAPPVAEKKPQPIAIPGKKPSGSSG